MTNLPTVEQLENELGVIGDASIPGEEDAP
jgi:hypothetical protein